MHVNKQSCKLKEARLNVNYGKKQGNGFLGDNKVGDARFIELTLYFDLVAEIECAF